jgi:CheY-like chemotaxis protein
MKKFDKVLVIDDDPIYNYSLQILLTNHQMAKDFFTSFIDAEEAILFLEQHSADAAQLPDVIFLDISMPMMSGWEFLEEYKELSKQFCKPVELFVVSSSINRGDILRAKSYKEVSDYITKPLTSQVLQKMMAQEASLPTPLGK